MLRWIARRGRGIGCLICAVLVLILGSIAPAHAGPPITSPSATIQPIAPDVQPAPVVQLHLVAYRAHGPPSGALFFVVLRGYPYSAAVNLSLYGGYFVPNGVDPLGLDDSVGGNAAVAVMLLYLEGLNPGFTLAGSNDFWFGDSNSLNVADEANVRAKMKEWYEKKAKELCLSYAKLTKGSCPALSYNRDDVPRTLASLVQAYPGSEAWRGVIGTSSLYVEGTSKTTVIRQKDSSPACCNCKCTVNFGTTWEFFDTIDANPGWNLEGLVHVVGDFILHADFNIHEQWNDTHEESAPCE